MNDLQVSWDHYHRLIERLALIVWQSDWQCDEVLCLARGGMRVGDVLSRLFKKPLAVLVTSSYRADHGTTREELLIAAHLSSAEPIRGKRLLVVDDMADSGHTLVEVLAYLRQHHSSIEEVRTAVLWHKAESVIKPDYAVECLNADVWIHQPFEQYDAMDLSTLAQRLKA